MAHKKDKLYIMIKRKQDKIWMGAVPCKNISIKDIKLNLSKNLPVNIQETFQYKIVSEGELLNIIMANAPDEDE